MTPSKSRSHCAGDPRDLVLASGSPRRQDLLRMLGLRFQVDVSHVPEVVTPGRSSSDIVSELALAKAQEVASRHDGSLIIAADTLVECGPAILGKPKDATAATEMLQMLSGVSHRVVTGVVVLDVATLEYETRVVETEVWFRPLTSSEIEAYVLTSSQTFWQPWFRNRSDGKQFHSFSYEGR